MRYLTVALLAVLGCQASGKKPAKDDALVSNDEPVASDDSSQPRKIAFRLSDKPLLDLGGGDDSATHFLGATPVHRLSDGRVLVYDYQSSELRVFGADGKLLRRATRRGGGPGEVPRESSIVGHVMAGDSVAVLFENLGTVFVFDSSITFRRSIPVVRPNDILRLSYWRPLVLRDGSIVAAKSDTTSPCKPAGLRTVRLDWERIVDTLTVIARWNGLKTMDTFVLPMKNGCSHGDRFRPRIGLATDGDKVYYAFGDKYDVQVFDRGGNEIQTIRWPGKLVPFNSRRVKAYLASLEKPSRTSLLEQLGPPPQFIPAIKELKVDAAGNVWAREYLEESDGSSVWNVVGPNGALVGQVIMAPGFTPSEIGAGYVLGVYRDEDGVEHVQVFALEPA